MIQSEFSVVVFVLYKAYIYYFSKCSMFVIVPILLFIEGLEIKVISQVYACLCNLCKRGVYLY